MSLLTVDGELDYDAYDTVRRVAFHGDGAIVVDGSNGVVIACGWFVGDIKLGGERGGARSRSARAVAQQAGGCYVIKASEDSKGDLEVFLGERTAFFTAAKATCADGMSKLFPSSSNVAATAERVEIEEFDPAPTKPPPTRQPSEGSSSQSLPMDSVSSGMLRLVSVATTNQTRRNTARLSLGGTMESNHSLTGTAYPAELAAADILASVQNGMDLFRAPQHYKETCLPGGPARASEDAAASQEPEPLGTQLSDEILTRAPAEEQL